METKPYRIQSPEDIAKDYGGNKQKIAQAMQLGVVDPTAGVLAGMFIDRMRSAQAQEAAPQPSVAQQVMGGAPAQAPLAPAGGLGATAPAMPPMAPQSGVGMAPPPGMAAGGFVPPYMKASGLGELPLPDTMFDENRDGGYAGGGIVAFAEAGAVNAPAQPSMWGGSLLEQIPGAYEEAEDFYARYMPERTNEGLNLLTTEARKTLDPTQMKKRASQDKWMTLAEIGFNMASSNSPYLLQAVGASAAAALPGAKQAKKEREAAKREAIRDLAAAEDITYKQAMDKANYVRGVAKDKLDLADKEIGRKFTQQQVQYQEGEQTKRTGMQIAGGIRQAEIGAGASRYGSDQAVKRETIAATREASRFFDTLTEESPKLKQKRILDPIGYARDKTNYIREYVYGPK